MHGALLLPFFRERRTDHRGEGDVGGRMEVELVGAVEPCARAAVVIHQRAVDVDEAVERRLAAVGVDEPVVVVDAFPFIDAVQRARARDEEKPRRRQGSPDR